MHRFISFSRAARLEGLSCRPQAQQRWPPRHLSSGCPQREGVHCESTRKTSVASGSPALERFFSGLKTSACMWHTFNIDKFLKHFAHYKIGATVTASVIYENLWENMYAPLKSLLRPPEQLRLTCWKPLPEYWGTKPQNARPRGSRVFDALQEVTRFQSVT